MSDYQELLSQIKKELNTLKDVVAGSQNSVEAGMHPLIDQALILTKQALRGELNREQWQQGVGSLMISLGKADVAFDQRNQQAFVQINIGKLQLSQPLFPKRVDPEKRNQAENRFRQRIKDKLSRETPYYVPLSGETTEAGHLKRCRIRPEYQEWIQTGQEIKRVKLQTLREGVDKYPCIILLGDPGCGKTTALEHLAVEFADDPDFLPLPLRLSEFEPGMTVTDFIVRSWAGSLSVDHWGAPELADNLEYYLKEGSLFCMFDALNEMAQEEHRIRAGLLRGFIERWSSCGNRFLVTCRVLDYGEQLSGLQRVEILPLNDGQIRRFLRHELGPSSEDLWLELTEEDTAQRRLLEMARNPYMLTIMIDVFKEQGHLARNRSELMQGFTGILLGWFKRKCPSEKWIEADVMREALAKLAFEIQDRSGFGTMVKTANAMAVMPEQVQPDPKWPSVPSPPDQVLRLAASAHIIEMTEDRSSLRFYHQLLQEYFAACEMLKRDPGTLSNLWRWPWLEKDMPKLVRPENIHGPLPPPPPTNWEETTILAAGLMPENDDQLVRAMIRVNPVLAGRCLHEGKAMVGRKTRETVKEALLATLSESKVALRVRIAAGDVLGYLGDPRLGELVTIPAGKFLMGDDQDDRARPQHEVFLPDYQIGKYPVTNAEFAEFTMAGGYNDRRWWTADGWSEKEKRSWIEPRFWDVAQINKPNQPVVGVSWYECLAYCHWLRAETGKTYRLPSEARWEKAARGTDGRVYPWAEQFEHSRLNAFSGNQIVLCTTPVGIYPEGASPYGCLDMAGNVWEWTSSQSKNYPYDPDDGRESQDAGYRFWRMLRGGSWFFIWSRARCSSRWRFQQDVRWDHIGFRVVVFPISAL